MNTIEFLSKYIILLASQSPRRKELIEGLKVNFKQIKIEVEELFPIHLKAQEIPLHLAKLKANAIDKNTLKDNEIVLTADTIVWINNKVLNKPLNLLEAKEMLKTLSNNMHEVFTAVCLFSNKKEILFYDKTEVYFNELSEKDIDYYLANFKPLDKAGAYGIQEWIGYTAIKSIKGDFYNVMGLPINLVYKNLKIF